MDQGYLNLSQYPNPGPLDLLNFDPEHLELVNL